jgi:AAA domain
MAFKSLTVHGFRGFAEEETIDFAIPNGEPGSGLTMLVGPNSGGKTTLIEALALTAGSQPSALPEGHRNTRVRQRVTIRVKDDNSRSSQLATIEGSGGQLQRTGDSVFEPYLHMFVLPSRRAFAHIFGPAEFQRSDYMNHFQSSAVNRPSLLNEFTGRLGTAIKNKTKFNDVLRKVLNPVPDWTLERGRDGQFYLKFFGEPGLT